MKGMSCPKECHYINYLFMIIYDQNQNFNRLSVNPEGAGAIAGNWQSLRSTAQAIVSSAWLR